MILMMGVERGSKRPFSIIVFVGVLVAIVFMGGDIIPLTLRPLKYLGISFPKILQYTHLIAPALALVLGIVLRRFWPNGATMVCVVLCILCAVAVSSAARWADQQVEKVKITKCIDGNDIPPLEARLGFKVWETGNSSGTELWIDRTPGHALQLTDEAKRMGIFRL